VAENSKIEWTDHTVNFWWGCAKEAMRFERQAVAQDRRFRVFTNSMADFFEDRRDLDTARLEALEVIRDTPHLDWLILTKRPEKILNLLARAQMLAQGCDSVFPGNETAMTEWLDWWLCGKAPANIWLGATVEDQEHVQRASDLQLVPAAVRFLSMEPLMGPVDLWPRLIPSMIHGVDVAPLDWIICGGESGPHARPMYPDWARGLRDQCAAEGVPFLFKQWGEWAPVEPTPELRARATMPGQNRDVWAWPDGTKDGWRTGPMSLRIGKHAAGRLLDGVEHNGYPTITVQAEA